MWRISPYHTSLFEATIDCLNTFQVVSQVNLFSKLFN